MFFIENEDITEPRLNLAFEEYAQFTKGKRMFSHGTLLFNSDLGKVTHALDVKMGEISSKVHKSGRSRLANISEFMKKNMDLESIDKQHHRK